MSRFPWYDAGCGTRDLVHPQNWARIFSIPALDAVVDAAEHAYSSRFARKTS